MQKWRTDAGSLVQAAMVVLLYLLLNYQSYSLIPLGSDAGMKFYHAYFLIAIPFLLRGFRFEFKKGWPVLLFFYVVFISSVLAGFQNGMLPLMFFNYVFAFLAFLVSYSMYEQFHERVDFIGMIRVASLLVMVAVLVKLAFSWEQIQVYLNNPMHHPAIFFFYGGGPNMEATWVLMNGVFFSRSRWFWAYWIVAIAIAVIYSSRMAFILGALMPLLSVSTLRRSRSLLILPGVALFLFLLVMQISPYILDRFLSIGDDPGSLSRLELWRGAFQILHYLPLHGYGAGNAVDAIYAFIGEYPEDNLHNYFLQVLFDFGILGLFAWAGVIVTIITAMRRELSGDPFAVYLLLFLVGSMLQFRGAEALFWSVMGFFLASRNTFSPQDAYEQDRAADSGL